MSVCTADYARTMARYNQWQNAGLIRAADTLDDAARAAPRGAFFGSLNGTFNHLLWGDRIWMSRFAGTPPPAMGSIAESVNETADWRAFMAARTEMDQAIIAWAEPLADSDLAADLSWYSGAAGRDVTRPLGLLVVHFFNHQTHHRGQIHTLLTQTGATPGDTDLFLMPKG